MRFLIRVLIALVVFCHSSRVFASDWLALGPWAGRLIVGAAADTRGPAVYVSTSEYGVFVSTDGAETWHEFTSSLEGTDWGVVAIDPTASDTIYAYARSMNAEGGYLAGLWRSTNGGRSWTIAREGSVRLLVSDGIDTLWGWFDAGILMTSVDKGSTWTALPWPGGQPRQIAFPGADRVLVATYEGTLLSSDDGGRNWSPVVMFPSEVLSVTASHDGIVFAGTSRNGVYRSSDGGRSWHGTMQEIPPGLVSDVQIDPRSPRHVYALFSISGVLHSTDGGSSWQQAADDLTRGYFYSGGGILIPGGGPQAVLVANRPGAGPANLANSAGILRSRDEGAHWEPANLGIPSGCDLGDGSTGNVFACGTEYGVWTTVNAGINWTQSPLPDWLNSSQIAVAPDNQTILLAGVLAAGDGAVFKMTPDGSWTRLPKRGFEGEYIEAIAFDPLLETTIYVCESHYEDEPPGYRALFYRSTDGGTTWQRLQSPHGSCHEGILIDPASPSTIYIGRSMSVDSGATWTLLDGSALLIVPGKPSMVYFVDDVSFSYLALKLAKSGDSALEDLPAPPTDRAGGMIGGRRRIAHDPDSGSLLLAVFNWGSELGDPDQWFNPYWRIYRSSDGGRSWDPFRKQLSDVRPDMGISGLTIRNGSLFAGTDWGLYTIQLDPRPRRRAVPSR